ncbi:MAG: hypothetical protein WBA44_18535 [Mesorhizobium sp.]
MRLATFLDRIFGPRKTVDAERGKEAAAAQDEPRGGQRDVRQADDDGRLPTRDDAFYLSMLHSHL